MMGRIGSVRRGGPALAALALAVAILLSGCSGSSGGSGSGGSGGSANGPGTDVPVVNKTAAGVNDAGCKQIEKQWDDVVDPLIASDPETADPGDFERDLQSVSWLFGDAAGVSSGQIASDLKTISGDADQMDSDFDSSGTDHLGSDMSRFYSDMPAVATDCGFDLTPANDPAIFGGAGPNGGTQDQGCDSLKTNVLPLIAKMDKVGSNTQAALSDLQSVVTALRTAANSSDRGSGDIIIALADELSTVVDIVSDGQTLDLDNVGPVIQQDEEAVDSLCDVNLDTSSGIG